ncbi:MAG: hypothetical protein WBN92_03450 [Terriglobia bacterium]
MTCVFLMPIDELTNVEGLPLPIGFNMYASNSEFPRRKLGDDSISAYDKAVIHSKIHPPDPASGIGGIFVWGSAHCVGRI